jgi:hypothetical protein
MKTAFSLRCARVVAAGTALVIGYGALAGQTAGEKPMKMDEPMSGEMKKEGTKKGDVKRRAEQWDRKMKDTVKKEEKTMSGTDAKQ